MNIEQVSNIRAVFCELYKECHKETELSQMYDEIRSLLRLELEDRAEEIGLDPDTVDY